jgi:hypothetical protein
MRIDLRGRFQQRLNATLRSPKAVCRSMASALALAAIRLVAHEHPEATADLIADDYEQLTHQCHYLSGF